MATTDVATLAICSHGASMLLLAMKMSAINIEQMKVIGAAQKLNGTGREAGRKFLQSTYYKSWSRAQLNNTEYAPMLSLLILALKYRADKANRYVCACLPSGAPTASHVDSFLASQHLKPVPLNACAQVADFLRKGRFRGFCRVLVHVPVRCS